MKIRNIQFKSHISLVILITIVFLGCNPQKLADKKAIKLRDERIAYLNTFKRLFIPEGVYNSYHEVLKTKTSKDKFGNIVSQTENLGTVKYEISFTGKKLIILNEQANIEEELIFTNEVSITEISNNSTSYGFEIASWKIRNHGNGETISDILPTIGDNDDPKREYRLRTILSVRNGENPRLQMWYGFRIEQFDGTVIKRGGNLNNPFESNILPFIDLEEMAYSYSQSFGPEFVNSARYEDTEYDLENYRD
jgi:hypothetical protein